MFVYLRVCFGVKDGAGREKKNEKEEIIASVQKRGETKEEKIIFSEERKLGCLKRNRKFEGIDPYFQFLLGLNLIGHRNFNEIIVIICLIDIFLF